MSQYFPKQYEPFGGDIVKGDLSNYAAKSDLASLKAEVDELDIDILIPASTDLSNWSDVVEKWCC